MFIISHGYSTELAFYAKAFWHERKVFSSRSNFSRSLTFFTSHSPRCSTAFVVVAMIYIAMSDDVNHQLDPIIYSVEINSIRKTISAKNFAWTRLRYAIKFYFERLKTHRLNLFDKKENMGNYWLSLKWSADECVCQWSRGCWPKTL